MRQAKKIQLSPKMKTKVTQSKVTQVNDPQGREDFRKSASRFTVYTSGEARDLAVELYYDKHDVGSMQFRCQSWDRVAAVATRAEIAEALPVLAKHFGCKESDLELKFSQKAGCSCGCSPGYIGKIVTESPFGVKGLSRRDVWVDTLLTTTAAMAIAAEADKQALKLPAELAAGAAQEAKRAEEKAQRDREHAEHTARYERYRQEDRDRNANAALDSASL